MKVFLGFLLSLVLLAGGGFGAYQMFMNKKTEEVKAVPFTNPFVEKPDSSFEVAQTATTNPFEDTSSDNPFGSTESSEYQNPFEALR